MSDATAAYPTPHAEGLSAPYWNATKERILRVQRCTSCGTLRHYPQVLCAECYSDEAEWVELSGRGAVHSWTVCHHAFHPGFAADLPYNLVTVDLEEGVRALGRLEDADALAIGLAVQARFVPRDDGFGQLTFVPA